MDILTGDQIAAADLTDWRKLAKGSHARFLVGDFGAHGVEWVTQQDVDLARRITAVAGAIAAGDRIGARALAVAAQSLLGP